MKPHIVSKLIRDVDRFLSFKRLFEFRVNHKLADVGPNAPNPFLSHDSEIQTPPTLEQQRKIDTAEKI